MSAWIKRREVEIARRRTSARASGSIPGSLPRRSHPPPYGLDRTRSRRHHPAVGQPDRVRLGLKNAKADLTEDRLFTISEGTREILTQSIDEPITARLYFSRRLAELAPEQSRYFQRVKALFEQYRDLSGGKLQLAVLDPEPFSDAEDRAVAVRAARCAPQHRRRTRLLRSRSPPIRRTATEVNSLLLRPIAKTFLEYDVTKLVYNSGQSQKARRRSHVRPAA